MKYRVKNQFADQEEMVTTFNGKAVALLKDIQVLTPASQSGPAKSRTIKMATQEEMKTMFKEGHPLIEEYEDQK